jgi:putative FmdB family regulatory protein
MPLFEYQCQACDHAFEELVASSDTPVVCPKCGSDQIRKLLSVFAASVGGSQSLPSCATPACGYGHSCGCGCHKG